MNINKIKKAFSFIIMQAPTGKAVHLSLILVIGVSLFSRHIISSSSGKALDLSQNPDFVKTEFSREDFLNGKAFSGELMHELVVVTNLYSRDNLPYVHIRSQNFINPSNANNSKCIILGVAYPGIRKPATINIDFNEVICEVNGIIESHKIAGHIWNIVAETVPAAVAFKKKLQSLKNDLKTETDESSIALIKYSIKKIEEAEPVLVLPARTQIQGAIIHQNNGGVVIETLN